MTGGRVDHRVLRELFRNLQSWQALFETEGTDSLMGHDGSVYCLADIRHLYESRSFLSPRQAQAIEMFLYRDMRERDVAVLMGVSPVNPVAIYATQGLRRLCRMYETGIPPGQEEPDEPAAVRDMPSAGGRGNEADH